MAHDDEVTPPRRFSSIQRIQQWGIVEVWLAEDDARGIVISGGTRGLRLTAIDPTRGERIEHVATDEDPSRAALRAIGRMNEGG